MKILITITGDNVAPRFDMVSALLIASYDSHGLTEKPRTLLMARPSPEELCSLILKENITLVICGGIEERHYKYLSWKKVEIFDSVIGPVSEVLDLAIKNRLRAGTILHSARNVNSD
jgi:predicted Fe-Mo cluster-binding NifX family protein